MRSILRLFAVSLLLTVACSEPAVSPLNGPRPVFLASDACPLCGTSVVVWESNRDGNTEIYSAWPDGSHLTNLTHNPATDFDVRVSPDGRRVAFSSNRSGLFHIYAVDPDGTNPTPLTSGARHELSPAWSPDGGQIAYRSFDATTFASELDIKNLTNGNVRHITTGPAAEAASPDWSPDGTQIVFHAGEGAIAQIYTLNMLTLEVRQLTTDDRSNAAARWSPDGSRIVFARSNEPDPVTWEIAVMDADGSNITSLTSTPEIEYGPSWSPDGSAIVYERYPNASVNIADLWRMNSDGSAQTALITHAADDRAPDWGRLPPPPSTDVPGQGIDVRLQYKDREWALPGFPGATGAEYWIQGVLAPDRLTRASLTDLGRIEDHETARVATEGQYSLRLTYGPSTVRVGGTGAQQQPTLVNPVDVDIQGGRTAAVTVDLTTVVGVITGSVRFNGADPGPGYVVCLEKVGKSSSLQQPWCPALADDGDFSFLLPGGDGQLFLCRTEDAANCGSTLQAGTHVRAVAIANVTYSVVTGQTTVLDPINITAAGLELTLQYQGQPPSANGTAYWIEGTAVEDRQSRVALGRIEDFLSTFDVRPGQYQLHLEYGPDLSTGHSGFSGGGSFRDILPTPLPSLRLDLGRTRQVTVDLTRSMGRLTGLVTLNGAEPGPGFGLCFEHSSARASGRWCPDLAPDGAFAVLLPANAGRLLVCRASDIADGRCEIQQRTQQSTPLTPPRVLASVDYAIGAGNTVALPTIALDIPGVEVALLYREDRHAPFAPPSATGAEYWIEGVLSDNRGRLPRSLGRIEDVVTAYGFPAGVYQLSLKYGPSSSTSQGTLPSRSPVLVSGVRFELRDGETQSVSVDLSTVVGVITGAIAFNGGAPGEGYSVCLDKTDPRAGSQRLMCTPLAPDGRFSYLLPAGTGTGLVCLTADADARRCVVRTAAPAGTSFRGPPAVITSFDYTVEPGKTTNLSG